MEDAPYDDTKLVVRPGDRLLLFSDGAMEIHSADDSLLGVDGLIAILKKLGYPARAFKGQPLRRNCSSIPTRSG